MENKVEKTGILPRTFEGRLKWYADAQKHNDRVFKERRQSVRNEISAASKEIASVARAGGLISSGFSHIPKDEWESIFGKKEK